MITREVPLLLAIHFTYGETEVQTVTHTSSLGESLAPKPTPIVPLSCRGGAPEPPAGLWPGLSCALPGRSQGPLGSELSALHGVLLEVGILPGSLVVGGSRPARCVQKCAVALGGGE